VHAPRNRAYKGTELLLSAVERARAHADLELDLVEGVTHAEAVARKRLSRAMERLRRSIVASRKKTLDASLGAIVESVESFCGDAEIRDDISILGIEATPR